MPPSQSTDLLEAIVKGKIASKKELDVAIKEAQATHRAVEQVLLEKKLITEDQLAELKAGLLGYPFIKLNTLTIRKDVLNLIPEPIASSHLLVAFSRSDTSLKIATLDPDDLQTFEFIKKRTGLTIEIYLTTPSDIREVLKQYHKSLKAEFEEITKTEISGDEEHEKLKELAQDLPIIRIVDTLLEYAIFEGASDIHIEPTEKEVVVRYRVDGILRDVMTLPKKTQAGIVARVKILANLKLDEHRLPQDGRFKICTNEYRISFRVSVIPVFDGEKIVLRLLNESAQILTLEQLGFYGNALLTIKTNIAKPHGMILVTGPTGSGKTTTLYTILNIINMPTVNITTIEDPIEYRMPRVNQSQVNPKIGYTFAAGLRAFLRQDPNVIMVGEIRDSETADIAVNAAMTGHLVLSTLHTNDAATAFPRLQDMQVASFLIASTVNVVIAQRLTRKICQNCKQPVKLERDTVQELSHQFDLPAIMDIFVKEKLVETPKERFESLEFWKGKGCKQCNQEGYKGRVGIYEVLSMSPAVADLILKRASAEEINTCAKKEGMYTMVHDGFMKAKQGITTIEELLRVTKD
ncbi:MAG: ATPase, T2SS/T4P/T4SS family [Patescibacteria group bacterium]